MDWLQLIILSLIQGITEFFTDFQLRAFDIASTTDFLA